MEDGLFPGDSSLFGGEEELEEERRLAYVGMTRAKEELTITAAGYRVMRGQAVNNPVSMFVREIPSQYLDGSLPYARKNREDGYPSGFYQKPYAPTPRRDIEPEKKPFAALKAGAVITKGSIASSSSSLDYKVGDRVRHIKFGEGVVSEMENRDGSVYVTVEFDKSGRRVLSAAFAKLVKC